MLERLKAWLDANRPRPHTRIAAAVILALWILALWILALRALWAWLIRPRFSLNGPLPPVQMSGEFGSPAT